MSASKIGSGNENFDRLLERLGYAYDQSQGIFVSILHAWQRDFGYCRLYDEAAALFSMIIDCEPIYFSYGGKRWLIGSERPVCFDHRRRDRRVLGRFARY